MGQINQLAETSALYWLLGSDGLWEMKTASSMIELSNAGTIF
jgi:hypothetical protein